MIAAEPSCIKRLNTTFKNVWLCGIHGFLRGVDASSGEEDEGEAHSASSCFELPSV